VLDAAAEYIDESHRKFIRRSKLPIPGPASQQPEESSKSPTISDDVTVLLLDSIGELASLYALADGAFVGGSLVSSGGHNILEPAAFGKIPVFGSSMENFAEIASRFVSAVLPFKWKARKTLALPGSNFFAIPSDEKNE